MPQHLQCCLVQQRGPGGSNDRCFHHPTGTVDCKANRNVAFVAALAGQLRIGTMRGEPGGDRGHPTPIHCRHGGSRCGRPSFRPDLRRRRCHRCPLHGPRGWLPHRWRLRRRTQWPNRFGWRRRRLRRWRRGLRRWRLGRRRDKLGRRLLRYRWRWDRLRWRLLGCWRRWSGLRWRFGHWRRRFRLSSRCRRRLLEHQLDRGFFRWRRQRRCHDHDQRRDCGGVQQERRQPRAKVPVFPGGYRRSALPRSTEMLGGTGIRQRPRTTPFWNVITYHHKRLSSSRATFGKRRLPFRLGTKSGTIVP